MWPWVQWVWHRCWRGECFPVCSSFLWPQQFISSGLTRQRFSVSPWGLALPLSLLVSHLPSPVHIRMPLIGFTIHPESRIISMKILNKIIKIFFFPKWRYIHRFQALGHRHHFGGDFSVHYANVFIDIDTQFLEKDQCTFSFRNTVLSSTNHPILNSLITLPCFISPFP